MPKLKTRKTLMKRIKITKNGKVMRKQSQIGHLKVKWDASKHARKGRRDTDLDKGHRVTFKKLLGKAGRHIQ
jgi:ribosomal protein L35